MKNIKGNMIILPLVAISVLYSLYKLFWLVLSVMTLLFSGDLVSLLYILFLESPVYLAALSQILFIIYLFWGYRKNKQHALLNFSVLFLFLNAILTVIVSFLEFFESMDTIEDFSAQIIIFYLIQLVAIVLYLIACIRLFKNIRNSILPLLIGLTMESIASIWIRLSIRVMTFSFSIFYNFINIFTILYLIGIGLFLVLNMFDSSPDKGVRIENNNLEKELIKLNSDKENGLVSEEEYQKKKSDILRKLTI